jgi:hypothetical protein
MNSPPARIDNATLICYTPIDSRHRHTGNCRQIVSRVLQSPAAGLAICQYDNEPCYYLFGCDENWQTKTDTWHQTLEDAKDQAEFEYEGVSATWINRSSK